MEQLATKFPSGPPTVSRPAVRNPDPWRPRNSMDRLRIASEA